MIAKIAFNFVGATLFLFLFWRKLKDDYDSDSIFTSAVYILLGIFVFNFISANFWPEWWFWTSLLGAIIGFIIGKLRFKFRFFESLEALAIGLLPWLSLIFLHDAIFQSSLSSIIAFLVILLVIVLYSFFDLHYKKFTWYKSGKVGFSGLMTLGVFFIIRTGVAVFFPTVLSFLGPIDSILSGVIAFTSFLLVFNLSRQQT